MNSIAAVVDGICCTRADSTNTIASCTNARPQNSGPFARIVRTSVGDDAVNQAVAAVTTRPKHIQPYTAFRKTLVWTCVLRESGDVAPCRRRPLLGLPKYVAGQGHDQAGPCPNRRPEQNHDQRADGRRKS